MEIFEGNNKSFGFLQIWRNVFEKFSPHSPLIFTFTKICIYQFYPFWYPLTLVWIYEFRKQSPLEEAVKADRKDLIHLMIIELGFDIESQSHYLQEPALFTAISKGDKGWARHFPIFFSFQ